MFKYDSKAFKNDFRLTMKYKTNQYEVMKCVSYCSGQYIVLIKEKQNNGAIYRPLRQPCQKLDYSTG